MRAWIGLIALAALAAQAQTQPPAFPPRSVQDTFFGTVVDDPYRDLEDTRNPDVAAWAKSQADFARSQLDSLPGYKALQARLAELDDSVAASVGSVKLDGQGTLFFTRRAAKDNTLKLYRRDAKGVETLLVDPDDWQKVTGKPHAINYFAPSPDGQLLAFGISAAGSEEASLYVVETATRKRLGEPLSRAQYPRISWRPDSRSFFYLRQQEMKPGMPATQKYQYERSYLHVVGTPDSADVLVAGADASPRMDVRPAYETWVFATPGSRFAVAHVANGDQRELALYAAPLVTVGKAGTPWVRICDFKDGVTQWVVHGDDIYLLTYRDSTRYSVVRTRLSAPDFAKATTVMPVSERVLVNLAAAKDALYLEARDGTVKRLMRRPWGAPAASDVALPLEGSVRLGAVQPDVDGAIFSLSAWTRAREIYTVNRAGKVTNSGLQPLGPFDAPTGLVTTEVKVKSYDGAMVPLSIIHRADLKLDGSNPTLLYGYGSYGITEEPGYQAMRLAWLERGGVYAVANVRGSSVYGHDWYKAGAKSNKPNTWKDFIACAEYLIAQKYTSSAKLGILGGSAGGILVGRALTERPDLFAAVVSAVGVLDAVRAENTANGVPNIPEFGTVAKEDEFRALLAMSSYHHVKDGTPYPAVLLIHGVNDPRVDYWQSTKMAARLLAATTSGKPILLDLDFDAGHGIGNTKEQRQRQVADYYSFLLWQTGHPEFQRH
ncbi:MAG TPA: prolyl oligopeptidase family serine peptidase [Burkholderiales bacterium]|nr:prolyl oligopeptidase family serine peptidase [Burkholderiales bacterium]